MTKERLRRYRDIKKELAQVRRRAEAIESAMYSPKAQRLTGMPGGQATGRNAAEDLADKHIELLAHYRDLEAESTAELLAIERAIERLDPIERMVLRCHYLDGLTWDAVCEKINYSWTQTHRIHGRALQKLKEEETPTNETKLY